MKTLKERILAEISGGNDQALNNLLDLVQEQEDERLRANSCTIYNLANDLVDEIKENWQEISESKYPEDLIIQYIDGAIPIYNYELLQYAMNDLWLCCEDGIDLIPDNPSAFGIIRANIYRELSSKVYGKLSDKLEELEQ